ncbi:hypothetical protein [Celeribacter ethanolicus]|uniref:hypothetical protein n=1 Tax=Celeribacter ethanolicus TaxID=1758178 RepID=UPI0008372E89|nr:hypothetical protein [Celeribacter ethanolicus]
MNHFSNITSAEAAGIKLALAQLIDERDLKGAVSMLEATIEGAKAEKGHVRDLYFDSLFMIAHS